MRRYFLLSLVIVGLACILAIECRGRVNRQREYRHERILQDRYDGIMEMIACQATVNPERARITFEDVVNFTARMQHSASDEDDRQIWFALRIKLEREYIRRYGPLLPSE